MSAPSLSRSSTSPKRRGRPPSGTGTNWKRTLDQLGELLESFGFVVHVKTQKNDPIDSYIQICDAEDIIIQVADGANPVYGLSIESQNNSRAGKKIDEPMTVTHVGYYTTIQDLVNNVKRFHSRNTATEDPRPIPPPETPTT